MTEILDSVISFWTYLMIPSFILGILGFLILFGVRNSEHENQKRNVIIGYSLFGQTFLIGFILFGLQSTLESRARNEIKEFLTNRDLTVIVNDTIQEPIFSKSIIKDLQSISSVSAHHSSPTVNIDIIIKSEKEIIKLNVQLDSEIKTEYWIFWNKYNSLKKNEVGRITTKNLLKYNGG